MKLLDLFEKLNAKVFVNDSKTLHLIADLVSSKFGLKFERLGGTCLAAQMVFSMSSVSGVSADDLANAINDDATIKGDYRGASLQSLYKVFDNKPISIGKKHYKFDLSTTVYDGLDSAISAVKSGTPVTFVIAAGTPLYTAIDDVEFTKTGIIELTDRIVNRSQLTGYNYHSLLIIGYDTAGYLILRDIRSHYLFKGYAKASVDILKSNPKAYKLLSINVEKVEEVKAPPKKQN